jgi:hypothetical protein
MKKKNRKFSKEDQWMWMNKLCLHITKGLRNLKNMAVKLKMKEKKIRAKQNH